MISKSKAPILLIIVFVFYSMIVDATVFVYGVPQGSTSIGENVVSFGEMREVEFDVFLVNESAVNGVDIPQQWSDCFQIFVVDSDGSDLGIPFSVDWRRDRNYNLDTSVIENEMTDAMLHISPGEMTRATVVLKTDNDRNFPFGDFTFFIRFDRSSTSVGCSESWVDDVNDGGFNLQIREVTTRDDRVMELYLKGALAERRRDFDLAEMKFREMLALEPSSLTARVRIGLVLFKKQEYAEGLPYLEETFRRGKGSGEEGPLSRFLAYSYLATGREAMALQVLSESMPREEALKEFERMSVVLETSKYPDNQTQ